MDYLKNTWTKFKCLLIGFDYNLLSDSSIKSKKLLTKYFSAILIIIIIWFFIGFQLVREYIDPDSFWLSLTMGVIFVVIIVMVERQIILSSNVNYGQLIFRTLLGVIMAFIGATIIDAALFKNDIDIRKKLFNKEKIEERVSIRNVELEKQNLDLENEKEVVLIDLEKTEEKIAKRGNKIQAFTNSYRTIVQKDSTGNAKVDSLGKPITFRVYERQSTLTDNPDIATATRLRNELSRINELLETNSKRKFDLRELVIKEVNGEKGIIQDLVILKDLLAAETVGFVFYTFWFLFFLMIELLVLVSKYSERNNTCDYYEKIKYQEEISNLKLKRLMKNSSSEV